MRILIDGQTLETEEINRGIGKYFKSVINNALKMDFVNEWFIAISDKKYIQYLEPWVREKICVIQDPNYSPNNFITQGYDANKQYTSSLKNAIEEKGIDVYWNPNPVMINVLFPIEKLDCSMYITFYDLIPYIFKKQYLDQWPKHIVDEYKRRLDYINSKECSLMFISEATKKDFDKYIGSKYGDSKITFLGADGKVLYRPYLTASTKTNHEIIFVGGFDFRKNLYRAVEAFAKAKVDNPNTVMDTTKLYLVCKCSEETKREFNKFLLEHKVENDVILTGFITDQELGDLYNTCDLFFFPSLYEGFGLPILEALLAGRYVLSGDNSSLPEVGKSYVDYCDAMDITQMSQKLYEAMMKATNESDDKKNERKEYALQYSWQRTAKETLDFLTLSDKTINSSRVKVAMVTPWLPQETGIAAYMQKLMPYLCNYMDIDLFVDDTYIKLKDFLTYEQGRMYSINDLVDKQNEYQTIVYHLGNNSEFHTKIYEMALKVPGIVEVHDYIIHPFMYHSFYLNNKKEVYKEALAYYGRKGKEHFEEVDKGIAETEIQKFPMIEYVCSKSKGSIVHSRWVADQLQNIENVQVIPLAVFDSNEKQEQYNKKEFCTKYDIERQQYIIGCMGFVNRNKRPNIILEAVSRLKMIGYPIKIVFFGKAAEYGEELKALARELNIENDIVITGFISEKEYLEGLYFSDLIINLRYPSMGESSATLCEAFKYAKPVVVSNINQYKEFPDEICWKLDIGENEVDQLVMYIIKLCKENKIRKTLGENAMEYSMKVLSAEIIAKRYLEVFKE